MVKAYAASGPRTPLSTFEYEVGPLREGQVLIDVDYCGICHSDLSMANNDWHMTTYPFVPGHEIVGTIKAVAPGVTQLKPGQRVGVGWFSHSCLSCEPCMKGDHNLCATAEQTMVGRYGGFADQIQVNQEWAIPLPDGIPAESAGPLFCGGITVFNPLIQCGVKATDRVGVVGIGGLGHMAIKFLRAWGCEVTAFSSTADKEQEARGFGAHYFVHSRDKDALGRLTRSLDFILSTVNVSLDWPALMGTLKPRGRLHVVGAVPEPISVPVFPMITAQLSLSASPLGSPATTAEMLEFALRHNVLPKIQKFPLSRVNDALAHLESGKARYRVVLDCKK